MKCPKHGLPVNASVGCCILCVDELNRVNCAPEVYEKGCYMELKRMVEEESR